MNLEKHRDELAAAYKQMGETIEALDRVIAYIHTRDGHTNRVAVKLKASEVSESAPDEKTKANRRPPKHAKRPHGFWDPLIDAAIAAGHTRPKAMFAHVTQSDKGVTMQDRKAFDSALERSKTYAKQKRSK